MNTVLIGMMGAGKTTVGRLLATLTGREFLDTDEIVVRQAGRPIADIFRSEGEDAFRRREAEVVSGALAGHDRVVALGGGAPLHLVMPGGRVVYLRARPETLRARVGDDPTRPLAGGLEALLAQRDAGYLAAADVIIDTDGLSAADIAARLARRVTVALPGRPYDVVVGSGALGDLPAVGRAALVGAGSLLDLYGDAVEKALEGEVLRIEVPDGEAAKTPAVLADIWARMAAARLARHDLLVGLGGGAATDVAGLAAATYLRGIRWVAVPTSLLGMVDAAIGGKTAIDLPEGKNLVGVVWQPAMVACDTDLLATLPDRELRSGWGEIAKYGFLGVPGVLAACRGGVRQPTDDLVRACVAYKAAVVAADERETGPRVWLNYGHTIGHAVEMASGMRMSHGESVAVGLRAAAHIGAAAGLADVRRETAEVLSALSLADRAAGLDRGAVEDALRSDKKRGVAGLRFVLLEAIGRPVIVDERDLPGGTVDSALAEVLT